MKIIIACERSGVVRDEFIRLGHDAMSCDLHPTDSEGPHYQGDIMDIINDGFDMMLAFPDCTYLTGSAEWAYGDGPYHQKIKEGTLVGADRRRARVEAVEFAKALYHSNIPLVGMENPVGHLSQWKEPDQYVQPYEYGDDASKKTCLWLKGLRPLSPTTFHPPRLALNKNGKGYGLRWGNQTDSGQNKESPHPDRAKIRSQTWRGIAQAMATQWNYP
jgi:hypothetical protein